MTNEQQTITPERQMAAIRVGGAFNSFTQFLQTLAHSAEENELILTEQLNEARKALQVASFWAVQHVLAYGVPKPKAANDAPPSNVAEVVADLNAPAGADALPPTTPTESV